MDYQELKFKDIEIVPLGSNSFLYVHTHEGIQFDIHWHWYHMVFAVINKLIRFIDLWRNFNEFRAQGFGGEIDEIFLIRETDDIMIRNKQNQQVIINSKWIPWIKEAIKGLPNNELLDSIKNDIMESNKIS